jgi:N-acyl homoserine lactone hydrolase
MRRLLRLFVLAIVVALGALAWTFTPARLERATVKLEELPKASPPSSMSLSTLPTGAMLSRAAFAFRGGSFAEEREFTMTVVLVRHPKGNLLFDAGFGRDVDQHAQMLGALMKATTTYRKGTPAADQLLADGFDLTKLDGVVLTHAHWDHVSGLDDLRDVPVWLSAAERDFIASSTPATQLIRAISPAKYRTYEFDGGEYLGYPRSHDVWGDGSIVLVPAPGHTPGSIVAFLTLPSGTRYALLGDLVWQLDGVERPAERPWLARRQVDLDEESVRQHISLVAAIHKRFPEIQMLPAHDSRAFAALPVFPQVVQ